MEWLAKSWLHTGGILHTTEELLTWVEERNINSQVTIKKIPLSQCSPWFYDQIEGVIRNENRSFFQISGFHKPLPNGDICSQPMILQYEIGYLGILCKQFDGVMHFLMQAKIEPGNVNQIQISPTIQATKSNFTQKHGGKRPSYIEYFLNAKKHHIIADQLQSEQSSRFYGKRNRNILLYVEEDIPLLPSHRWMTLGQIKALMHYDNLVNMDTRTVLSCIPFYQMGGETADTILGEDPMLIGAVTKGRVDCTNDLFHYINDYKMLRDDRPSLVSLTSLADWRFDDHEIVCKKPYPFKVIFCDIDIEGREVKHWTQPLFEATGIATFGLIVCLDDGVLKCLVKARPEVGCFDGIELGPTVQREANSLDGGVPDMIEEFFDRVIRNPQKVLFDHLLSEEGGRFYCEQNRNLLVKVEVSELPPLPAGYFLVDFYTLNQFTQRNNVLNIQLRNLLSLLERSK